MNKVGSSGVASWTEAVQYFLRTYATPSAISNAAAASSNITQEWNEYEKEYADLINEAACRCGNVQSKVEKMTIFVDWLIGTIYTTSARYREDEPRRTMTLERLVQYVRDKGETFR